MRILLRIVAAAPEPKQPASVPDDEIAAFELWAKGEGYNFRSVVKGWVRMRESLRFTSKILSATVSRVAEPPVQPHWR